MNYFLLLVGFILLIKGADIFVDGASSIAKKLGIPPVIVGLTIVSIGTSAPELAVSLISGMNGNNDIAIGNVLGSNIFNLLMVLGVTMIVLPVTVVKKKIKTDFLINVFLTCLLFVFSFDTLFGNSINSIGRIDGAILFSIAIIYTLFLVVKAKKNKEILEDEKLAEDINLFFKFIFIILGIISIVVGGQLVVDSATNIAKSIGMSEKLIGLTIVAMGTSLPELVTSVVAALKGENDIALGNVMGSNIFNIILILGTSTMINPISVASNLMFDFIFLIAINIFMYIVIFSNKNKEKILGKFNGFIFVLMYVFYMVYIIFRN